MVPIIRTEEKNQLGEADAACTADGPDLTLGFAPGLTDLVGTVCACHLQTATALPGPAAPRLERAPETPGGLVSRLPGPTPGVCDSVELG